MRGVVCRHNIAPKKKCTECIREKNRKYAHTYYLAHIKNHFNIRNLLAYHKQELIKLDTKLKNTYITPPLPLERKREMLQAMIGDLMEIRDSSRKLPPSVRCAIKDEMIRHLYAEPVG